jgi:hypothetical protein
MAYDADGFWEEDEDDYNIAEAPPPPNSAWNEEKGGWDTTAPSQPGYDPTWGGYVDPNNPKDPHAGWLDSVYEAQGWPQASPAPAAPAPSAPKQEDKGGGGGGGSQPQPQGRPYTPPAFTPSPFIMPNGMVPPGMPFSPDPTAIAQQNAALKQAMETPAVTPGAGVDPELMRMQDTLLKQVLQGNPFGPEYMNKLNEQQKEIALARAQSQQRGLMQRAANRGTLQGGAVQAGMRRVDDEASRNILQAHRDASLQTGQLNEMANRQATQLGESILGGREDRAVGQQALNRNALLDALMASENIYGGRENRGLAVSKFAEAIRQYDQDLLNRQAEFGSSLGFNYDSLNAGSYNSWLNYLANLSK